MCCKAKFIKIGKFVYNKNSIHGIGKIKENARFSTEDKYYFEFWFGLGKTFKYSNDDFKELEKLHGEIVNLLMED